MSNCRDWNAWHDHMPGPGSTPMLHVTGTCEFATAGYSADPRKHEPQGINPKDLLLDLVVHERYGDTSAEVLTDVPANFSEETSMEYDTVSIVDVDVGIPVQETSRPDLIDFEHARRRETVEPSPPALACSCGVAK